MPVQTDTFINYVVRIITIVISYHCLYKRKFYIMPIKNYDIVFNVFNKYSWIFSI